MSKVDTKERDIFWDHQIDFIYAQSGILYKIITKAPSSNHDPKFKIVSHAYGIIGYVSVKVVEQVTNQLQNLSIN